MAVVNSQSAVLFRSAVCVLLVGLELVACLVGKLMKEQSTRQFDYFYSFCGGILLAKGLFCGLFDAFSISTGYSAGYSLTLFSSAFVFLTAVNIALKNTGYSYRKILSLNGRDDENSLGIELGELPVAADDEESDEEEGQDNTKVSEDNEGSIRLFWSTSIIAISIINEGAHGLQIIYAENDTHMMYFKILLQGFLLCLACGAILEDTVHNPTEFVRALILLIMSLPLGLFLGSYVVNWFDLSYVQVLKYTATVYPIAAGCYTATAMIHMLPSEHEDKKESKHLTPHHPTHWYSMLFTSSKIRAMCFILGYFLTSTSARLV